jgi:molecular chaperone HtpG
VYVVKEMNSTKAYLLLQKRKSLFLSQVNKAIEFASKILPMITKVFQTYTLHGMTHSVHVAEYMYELIDDAEKMSDLEIVMLIYAALFHDIGMVVSDREIEEIKIDKLLLGNRKYSKVFQKYNNENIALQECVRPVHGKRSRNFLERIDDENKELFLVSVGTATTFQNELALICQSHNEDFEWISKEIHSETIKGEYSLNAQYIAVLLRIADYLDMDAQRAPLYLYKYLNPTDYSDLEWRQHFDIDNYTKIVLNEKTGQKKILFIGSSKEPAVHRKLLKYFDDINKELLNAVNLCQLFGKDIYLLNVYPHIINNIKPDGFTFSDYKLELNYKAITNLLMGENIYGDKKYGLREIIQNSIDACKTMEETAQTHENFIFQKYEPIIIIALNKEKQSVTILDNGSGMNVEILKKYFLNVGVSYYNSDAYNLQGREYSPIGHYGIGFLSCFMLSDKVEVRTKHIEENKIIKIEFEKNSEYICLTYEDKSKTQGTEIVLDYEQFMSIFPNGISEIKSFVEDNFLDCGVWIKILVQEKSQQETYICNLSKPEDVLAEKICLNQYLDGIEAYVECNYKGLNFAKKIKDLNGNKSYYYNQIENEIIEEDNMNISIKQFVVNNLIRILTVPSIMDEAYEFAKIYEKTDDFDQTLSMLDEYDVYNIIPTDSGVVMRRGIMEGSEDLIGNYSFEMFCEDLEHDDSIPTKTDIKVFQVVLDEESECILPFKSNVGFGSRYPFEAKDQVYLKSILLPNLKIILPYLADGVILKNAVINIEDNSFYPNVSRDRIGKDLEKKLCYAIGKALHMWLLDNLDLSFEQRKLLNKFIATYYPEKKQ